MYKCTHRFSTRDGSWVPDGRQYSITQADADKYGANFPEKGDAVGLFAKIEGGPGKEVLFFTRDNGLKIPRPLEPSGWAHFDIEHSSAFVPDRGETGWWNIKVNDAPSETAEGFGLENSWHISHFAVFTWQAEGQDDNSGGSIDTPPTPPVVPPAMNNQTIGIAITLSEGSKITTYYGTVSKVGG